MKILKVIGAFAIALSLTACSEEDSADTKPVKTVEAKAEPEFKEGANYYLGTDVIMGIGKKKDNLDEVVKYASANNKSALESMVSEGKALIVAAGTPITLVEYGVLSAKVKLTETGTVGWVPSEMISKDKP